MFEDALVDILKEDTELASYVSEYYDEPSVFSESAPADAAMPYITLYIDRAGTNNPAADRFTINIDYWDDGESWVTARSAAQRIDEILDRVHTSNLRYDTIRIFRGSGGPVRDDQDPRLIHYNVRMEARAGRSAWAALQ